MTNQRLLPDMQSGSVRSHPRPALSTGKGTSSSSHRSAEPPASKPSEYVEEISDSDNSDEERSIGSDDEERVSKLETTARSKSQETHELAADLSSGVHFVTSTASGSPVPPAWQTMTDGSTTMLLARYADEERSSILSDGSKTMAMTM